MVIPLLKERAPSEVQYAAKNAQRKRRYGAGATVAAVTMIACLTTGALMGGTPGSRSSAGGDVSDSGRAFASPFSPNGGNETTPTSDTAPGDDGAADPAALTTGDDSAASATSATDCDDYADSLYGSSGICSAWLAKYTCENGFCTDCVLGGYCDSTCGYCDMTKSPVATPTAPPTTPPAAAVDEDSSAACDASCVDDLDASDGAGTCATYVGQGFGCDSFFCDSCGFASKCDATCGFCTACDRRLLAPRPAAGAVAGMLAVKAAEGRASSDAAAASAAYAVAALLDAEAWADRAGTAAANADAVSGRRAAVLRAAAATLRR